MASHWQPNEQERAVYRALYRDIEQNRARWLAFDAVVIDLRKNSGGSSAWSTDFAKALWGEGRAHPFPAGRRPGLSVRQSRA